MKKPPHNLKLIMPLKQNELFSITKYQKKTADNFSNSFFNTYYKIHNKIKFPVTFLNITDQLGISLNKTGPFKNYNQRKSNLANTNNKKLELIPYPSFPNKKPIQSFYKNSTKLVKYPKIQKDNFILYNYRKNDFTKNKDETKFFNTFTENRISVETQTYSMNKNKTNYKEKNNFDNLNISAIKKESKIKYSYKLYNLDNIKKIKNEIKKKLNINNFDKVLDNLTRLIDMRDEHNKDIKYIKVTNLLLDEINKLLEANNKKKQNNINRKKYKNISTSISQKYFKRDSNKLDLSDDDAKYFRKKIRFKTFIPKLHAFRTKYSFNSELGNKVEDKLFNDYENKKENEIMSNTFPKNVLRNNIIQETKNENNSVETEEEEDSDSPMQTMKSKYHANNLFNLMNEKKGAKRININFDINNHNKSSGNNNIYNTDTNFNNNFNNNTFGKTTNFNNFVKQSSKGPNQLNILNIIKDLTSKLDNKPEPKKNRIERYKKKELQKENIKNRSSITQDKDKKDETVPNIKEKIEYKKYFKNEKLINLIKQFTKLENIDEQNSKDENSDKDSESEEELNNDTFNNENENIIEGDENHRHIEIGKIKRKERRAKTSVIKRIDFGIEIIKNICEDINLYQKEKDDLYNIFINIKNISSKPEITKEEEKIQNKSLKLINGFIKKYLIDMQKMGLTKEKQKIFLNKYFKNNLNNKLKEILNTNNKSENNTLKSQEHSKQKKSKNRPKNIQKKKLVYDNSYFFKSTKEKKVPLKDINISQKEESIEESIKEKKMQKTTYHFPKEEKEKKYERRNAIFKVNKKREGLIRLLPSGQIILKEGEKKIDKENLLDRRLNAFFEEIKILKNINNNSDKLNSMIDKEMEKIDYARDKKIEGRKYNFYEELKIKRGLSNNDKKFFNAKRYLSFQSPVIFNIHKDK